MIVSKFKEKESLNFILLSDLEYKLPESFKIWAEKSTYGRKYMYIERSTFVLYETDLIYINDGQGNKQKIKNFLSSHYAVILLLNNE